jgi:hypothetical protein
MEVNCKNIKSNLTLIDSTNRSIRLRGIRYKGSKVTMNWNRVIGIGVLPDL